MSREESNMERNREHTGKLLGQRGVPGLLALTVTIAWIMIVSGVACADTEPIRITILYNNVPGRTDCTSAWGFSCLVEGTEKTLLFDTGGNGAILLSNMKALGIDPKRVDAIILSHIHGDHIGGLPAFLDRNHDVVVYLPASFPLRLKEAVRGNGATVEEISGPQRVCNGVYTTGELGRDIREQALAVRTPQGTVIITGCAHPGIVTIVETARKLQEENIYMILGGFHLLSRSAGDIAKIAARLKELGVCKVAPSHCTGERARKFFRAAWDTDFIASGLGTIITIPASTSARPVGQPVKGR